MNKDIHIFVYDKVNIKLPYDRNNECFDKNFKVYKLCDDNKHRLINDIKYLNDLRKYIRKGVIIKPIIYFQKVWFSFNELFCITLICEQLLIKGYDNLNLNYKFYEELINDEVIENNIIIKKQNQIEYENKDENEDK